MSYTNQIIIALAGAVSDGSATSTGRIPASFPEQSCMEICHLAPGLWAAHACACKRDMKQAGIDPAYLMQGKRDKRKLRVPVPTPVPAPSPFTCAKCQRACHSGIGLYNPLPTLMTGCRQ